MPRKRKPVSRRGKYDRSLSAEERHADQRTKLLDAATQVFATVGYTDATVEAIVARAGMSRRTYYEHFDDLRSILGAVYERAATISLAMVASAARAHDQPLDGVRAGLVAYLGAVAAYPEVARVMFEQYRLGGSDFEARYQRDSEKYAEHLREVLLAAHKAGAISREPSETAVFTLSKGIEGLAMRAIANGEHGKLPQLAGELFELVVGAFR